MADSKNVWAAGRSSDDEAFFGGPLGTPLPTDAIDDLNEALEPHGWMGDDGFVNNIQRDVTKHRDFAGTTIKTTQDTYEETVSVTCCESNPTVLKTVFGDDNVSVSYSGGHRKVTIRHDEAPLPKKSFVVRVVDGVKTRMLVIPEGQVTEVGEVTWLSSELVQYTLTIDCFVPKAGTHPENPAAVNEYLDEPDVDSDDEAENVVTLGTPSAGTFTLTFRGKTTDGIAYNATASAVKSALVALDDGFGASDWVVTGSAGGPYTILTPGGPLSGSGTGLTGGTFSVA